VTSPESSGSDLSPDAAARGSDLEFVRLGFDETPPRLIDKIFLETKVVENGFR